MRRTRAPTGTCRLRSCCASPSAKAGSSRSAPSPTCPGGPTSASRLRAALRHLPGRRVPASSAPGPTAKSPPCSHLPATSASKKLLDGILDPASKLTTPPPATQRDPGPHVGRGARHRRRGRERTLPHHGLATPGTGPHRTPTGPLPSGRGRASSWSATAGF